MLRAGKHSLITQTAVEPRPRHLTARTHSLYVSIRQITPHTHFVLQVFIN